MLTAPALAFVEDLTRRFRGRIDELLSRRRERQARVEGGAELDFLPETSTVRQGDAEELARVRAEVGPARFDGGRFDEARGTFERVATSDELAEFLTLPAYDLLVAGEVRGDRMRQET